MIVVLLGFAAIAAVPVSAEEKPQPKYDYLKIVRDYADAMIAHGQDVYGEEHSSLLAEALDRRTMRMLEGEALQKVSRISREEWGIRPHDRMIAGGNPQHCLNFYQILYVLTEVTGEKRYADEANRSLTLRTARRVLHRDLGRCLRENSR